MGFPYTHFGIPDSGFDPSRTFVRSHFLPSSVLGCLRLLFSLYCFITIIVGYVWQAQNLVQNNLKDLNIAGYTIYTTGGIAVRWSFSYFTWITWWSLGFYFFFSSIHTLAYARHPQSESTLYRWPKALQLLHSLHYTTVVCYPFLVTIVFWGTMYNGPFPDRSYERWVNISVHGLNSVFATVEIILSATIPPPVLSHISVLLVVLSLYLGLAYLTRYTEGFYVYEWLNPAHGTTSIILHILGYTVGIVALFGIVWCTIRIRNALAVRLGCSKEGLGFNEMEMNNETVFREGKEKNGATVSSGESV